LSDRAAGFLRIAVLNPSKGSSGGYQKYMQTLIPLLRDDPRTASLDVYLPLGAWTTGVEESQVTQWPAGDRCRRFPWLKRRLREQRTNVVFIPTARWLDCGDIPVVTMVRNMESLSIPFGGNRPKEAAKNLARAYAARRAVRRSTRTIAVSRYVRDFIIEHWRIDPGSIGVVYHGVDEPPAPRAPRQSQDIRGLSPGAFLFSAGSLRPARGLEDAIEALSTLNRGRRRWKLVIGGEATRETEFYLLRTRHLAEQRGVASDLLWAGQLDASEMSWCFSNCAVFVMTSRAEACPNTLLEAMSHGCLVVSTDQPPMPEFLEDSAIYYQAENGADLGHKLELALEASDEEKARRRTRAAARAREFDWRVTAEKTLSELELAARAGGDPGEQAQP
jgi:glycosyltransferase involved in cell wall biosynthesis